MSNKVMFHIIGNKKLGLGHVFRSLTLATKMKNYDICFLIQNSNDLAIKLVTEKKFFVIVYENEPYTEIMRFNPDFLINDILDTSLAYMEELRKIGIQRIVNFEDLGEGADVADAVINALYPSNVPHPNFYTGEKYYCIREEFVNYMKKQVNEDVKQILITYGGTDPNNLTLKTLEGVSVFKDSLTIDIVLGHGYDYEEGLKQFINNEGLNVILNRQVDNMAVHMYNADIVFTSAGRTMYEIATIGTPAVVTSQNFREITHTFGHPYNGFINLGYHSEIKSLDYQKVTEKLINDSNLRKLMNKRMLQHDLENGINRVINIIFNTQLNEKGSF